MAAPFNRISTEKRGEVTILRFRDSDILDQINIQEIGEEMSALVEQSPRLSLIVDFTGVQYLSSSALGKLLTLKRKIEQSRGKLRLCSIRKEILEVFQITRLDTIFDIKPNLESGLQGF